MSALMPDENANGIPDYSKKKVIWKTMKVNSPKIMFPNRESLRARSRFPHEVP